MNDKLYLVTRSDLEDGPKAVQTAHAVVEYTMEHPAACKAWYRNSNYIAMLEAKNEEALKRLVEKARLAGITFSEFYEPDRNDELTAVVFGPEAKRLCRHLPLAYAVVPSNTPDGDPTKGGSCALRNAHEPSTQEQVQR